MTKFTGPFEDVEVREPDEKPRARPRSSLIVPNRPSILLKLVPYMLLAGLFGRLVLWVRDYFTG